MQENVKQVIVKMTARRCFRTEPIWQYDGGHVLTFEGFDLPMSFEVHFSRSPMGNAIPQIGTNGVCTVPEMFTQNAGVIYAWLYIADVDSRLTKYSIEIPVAKRAKPTNQEPTPVEQSAIDQAIAALNAGVEAAEDAQEAAEAAQASAESYAESAGQSAITATNAATSAGTSATSAAGSATAAASSATDANASRQAADLSATNAGVSERNAAASATAAAGSATSAAASAGQASGSATAASGSASTASTKASEAAQSATAAAGSAESASENAGTASTAATAAEASATAAAGSATAAAGSATSAGQSATAAAGSAAAAQEVLESIPEDYSDLSDDVNSLKSAFNELEPRVDNLEINKADVIISSASGDIASFSDGAKDMPVKELTVAIEPVQNLHGYDSPWPAGGGKNKFNTDFSDTTINGTAITKLSDGKVSTSGVPTSAFDLVIGTVTLPAGDYILNGCPEGGGATKYRLQVTDFPVRLNLGQDSGSGVSFTLSEEMVVAVRIQVYTGASASLTYAPMIRLASETDATFEPYSNICPITGWDGVQVTRTGKNLLDGSNASSSTLYGVTFTPNSDGTITVNGTATQNINYFITNNDGIDLPNGSYVISGCPSGGGSTTYRLRTDNKTGQVRGNDTGNSATFTIDDGKLFATFITIWSGATCDNLVFHPQICLAFAPNPTDYEPYAGQVYDVTLPTEAGTVYGGELTIAEDGSGVLTVDRAEMVITGEEESIREYRVSPTNFGDYYCSIVFRTFPQTPSKAWDFVSNMLIKTASSFVSMGVGTGRFQTNNLNFTLCIAGLTTAEEYEAWIKQQATDGHPLTIVHELNTATTYTLTASEIRTLLGTNNVWADAGDVSVLYRADTKLYIDNKITEAIANALNA